MQWLIILYFLFAPPSEPVWTLPKPASIVELPAELLEISGLTDISTNTVACLQDESATIYIVDTEDGSIRERHHFGPPGDMEGLTRVKDDLFALRSDGSIFRLQRQKSGYVTTDSFTVQLPHNDIEGLGYDDRKGLVLIAPKDQQQGDKELKDQRSVYAFDPATLRVIPEPVLSYTVSDIRRAAEAAGMELPTRITPKGKEVPLIKFRMASIAVDPVSDNYFLLSAVDQTLLVLDRRGAFVALYLLDKALLPKPEGITFLMNGDMLISTEGKGTPPRLVRYAFSK